MFRFEQALPLEVTQDARSDAREQLGELRFARGPGRVERQLTVRGFSERAIEHDDVGVNVQVGGRTESLQKGHRTCARASRAAFACTPVIEAHERTDEDA